MSTHQRAHVLDGRDGPLPPPYQDQQEASMYRYTPVVDPRANGCTDRHALLGNRTYGIIELGAASTLKQQSYRFLLLLAAILTFGIIIGYISNVPINSAFHESLRREWAREENHRAVMREAWITEVQAHEELRAWMMREAKRWAQERQEYARRKEEERRDKEERERRERDEDERKRQAMVWEGLNPSAHCLRYGTREYSATLARVPLGYDALEECSKKSIEIHGREVSPSHCEDSGLCGRVSGIWTIDFDEAGCRPWWSYFKDKGCVGEGKHRYEAPLENLQNGDDWQIMCGTTPAIINGVHFDGPTSCVDWGKYGKWGIWLTDDENCF